MPGESGKSNNVVIVVGGNHATCDPSYFNREEIDYIVIGVGKKSFSELIEPPSKGGSGTAIPGIAKTSAGSSLSYIPRNYGVDDLMDHCPPRYDLVEKYREHYVLEKLGMKMGFVITAYGCTHACSFCTIPGTTGGKYLLHSPDSVIRDIGLLNRYPVYPHGGCQYVRQSRCVEGSLPEDQKPGHPEAIYCRCPGGHGCPAL